MIDRIRRLFRRQGHGRAMTLPTRDRGHAAYCLAGVGADCICPVERGAR